MNDEIKTHLSCLMDGELKRDSARFLLRRLSSDDQLRGIWSRYHLIRDCLQTADHGVAGEDLASRVRSALADAPASTAARPSRQAPGWLKPLAGAAIAATVAGMGVFALDGRISPAPEGAELAATEAQAAFTSPPSAIVGPARGNGVPVSASRPLPANSLNGMTSDNRINQYLLRHNQLSGKPGFVALVPIVATASNDRPAEDDNRDETRNETRNETTRTTTVETPVSGGTP